MNVYEERNRARRVRALVTACDVEALHSGIDPNADPQAASELAEVLATASPKFWEELSVLAKIRPPSPLTIASVVEHYRQLAQAGRRFAMFGAHHASLYAGAN